MLGHMTTDSVLQRDGGALRVPTFIHQPAFGSLMSQMVGVLTEKDSLGETVHHI